MSELAIKIRKLQKSFKGFHLGPLDLSVPKGAIYGLIGPNGAGKTTTIDLILGMGRKDFGEITVLGFDHLKDEAEMKLHIGYVSPELSFKAWRRVRWVLGFVRGFYPTWDDDYCRELLKRLSIDPYKKINTLSFGERVKVALILALSHRPEVLLLDEPTAGLDAVAKREIFQELLSAVQDETRTVLISSHGLSDVERFADHVGMIRDGRLLLEGPTSEIVDRYRMVDFVAENGFSPEGKMGFFVQGRDQNRWRVLMDTSGGRMESLRKEGVTEVSSTPVTLEDVFVALAKEEVE